MCVRDVFVHVLHKTHQPITKQSSRKRDANIGVEMRFNDWRYQLRSSRKNKVFGRCKSCKKMLFGTWSMQHSAQQRRNNSTLMGWMFRVNLGDVCGLEMSERPSILDFLFKTRFGPAEAWKPRGAVVVDPSQQKCSNPFSNTYRRSGTFVPPL
jgi:hypothetical protein